MGQCVSSQEDERERGGGRRDVHEERRSLMKHEGGDQEGEDGVINRNGDHPSRASGREESDLSIGGRFGREGQNGGCLHGQRRGS